VFFWKKDKRLYTLGFFDSIFNGLADIGAAIHGGDCGDRCVEPGWVSRMQTD
jgi:hypothetical protein